MNDEDQIPDRWCRSCDGLCTEWEWEMFEQCQTCWCDE